MARYPAARAIETPLLAYASHVLMISYHLSGVCVSDQFGNLSNGNCLPLIGVSTFAYGLREAYIPGL